VDVNKWNIRIEGMRYSEKEKGRKRKYGCKEMGVRINLGRDTASAKWVREI
jgi:hypothetical protein